MVVIGPLGSEAFRVAGSEGLSRDVLFRPATEGPDLISIGQQTAPACWVCVGSRTQLIPCWTDTGPGLGHSKPFCSPCRSLWHVKAGSRATGARPLEQDDWPGSQLAAWEFGVLDAKFAAHVLPSGRGKNRCREWSAPLLMDGELGARLLECHGQKRRSFT